MLYVLGSGFKALSSQVMVGGTPCGEGNFPYNLFDNYI